MLLAVTTNAAIRFDFSIKFYPHAHHVASICNVVRTLNPSDHFLCNETRGKCIRYVDCGDFFLSTRREHAVTRTDHPVPENEYRIDFELLLVLLLLLLLLLLKFVLLAVWFVD
ncbi:hypothetical protein SDJN03_28502, partial [Cucurbita argyrosperma subsp. sororia]